MKKKEVSTELTQEQLDILNAGFPVSDDGSNKLNLPRLGMLSKDITEATGTGKNKKIEIMQASGTFFTESNKGDVNEEGKKVWTKEFIESDQIEGVIVFYRRQLRMFDASLEKFYSTPIYDSADQIIPLYLDKQVIKRGTPAELQSAFPTLTLKGKPSSKLKEEIILYVRYNGELYQMNLSQSSKWEFMSYKRDINPSTVVTKFSSIEDSFGDNTFRKMSFTKVRNIDSSDVEDVISDQRVIKDRVEADKRFFVPELASRTTVEKDDLNSFDTVGK